MRSRRSTKAMQGFSIIEILVAFAILGACCAAMGVAVNNSMKSLSFVELRGERIDIDRRMHALIDCSMTIAAGEVACEAGKEIAVYDVDGDEMVKLGPDYVTKSKFQLKTTCKRVPDTEEFEMTTSFRPIDTKGKVISPDWKALVKTPLRCQKGSTLPVEDGEGPPTYTIENATWSIMMMDDIAKRNGYPGGDYISGRNVYPDAVTIDLMCQKLGFPGGTFVKDGAWKSCGDNGNWRWNPTKKEFYYVPGCTMNNKTRSFTCKR